MQTLSISEQFFLLAMTTRGTLSSMNEYAKPALLMASLLDLNNAGVIVLEKKKFRVVKEQVPAELAHLEGFYNRISHLRTKSLSMLGASSFEKELKGIVSSIREQKVEQGLIQTSVAQGFLQKEKVEYQAKESVIEELIETLKLEMQKPQPSMKMIALAILSQKARITNKYLSLQEQAELKKVLKQFRKSDVSKQTQRMFDDIDTMFVIIAATIIS